MSRFDAVLFDFDGVLIDSEPVHWACWAEVLAGAGVVLEWEYYRDCCIGIDDREMLRMMAAAADPPRDWQAALDALPGKEETVPRPYGSRAAFYRGPRRPAFAPRGKIQAGRGELQFVRGDRAAARIRELRHYFATVVGGESVPRGRHKPEPDPYLLAAERLGSRAPLVVEDSDPGAASGRAAGFEVLQVRSPAEVPARVLESIAAD